MQGAYMGTIVGAKIVATGISRRGRSWELIEVSVRIDGLQNRIIKGALVGSKLNQMLQAVLGKNCTGLLEIDLLECRHKKCVAQIKQFSSSDTPELDAIFAVHEFNTSKN